MQSTLTIFRREFASYFNSPIAYIFIIAFLVLNSGLFMTGFFLNGAADLRSFFGNLPFFLIFFIPAVSMRLWAEDKRTGTFELLITLPIRAREVMMGKYLAALAFYLVALAGTLPLPIMVSALGNPIGELIHVSGQPAQKGKKPPICFTCKKDADMERVIWEGIHWPGDENELPDKNLRLSIGRNVFGPGYIEPDA